MKKLLLLLVVACSVAFTASAYTAADSAAMGRKFSATTQLFLTERDGKMDKAPAKAPSMPSDLVPIDPDMAKHSRVIAEPELVDGQKFISCFIRVADEASVSSLEAKGVRVQCRFDGGLLTALVPVDSIESVALLSSVSRVNVASCMQVKTNAARQATNVDDALTNSQDAVNLGINSPYDGKGVVLGVIDTGIDFQHIAFKDASLSSRIKRAYVYNGTSAREYTSITSSSPTTDDSGEDHGTHTSSTAGGSSVIIDGSNVTVTTDHSAATYGGMAPGADLYLAGIKDLTTTYIANAFQKICNYADSEGKPVVVSNSWGSQMGPHDGTGDVADVVNQYFGESHPNHICLFAASNDAGKSKDGEGGGYYVSGTASADSPLKTIVRSASYSNTDAGYYYSGVIANAWSHTPLTSGYLTCRIRVLDASTGEEKTSVAVTPTASGARVYGLSSYYSGTLTVYRDYASSSKSQVLIYSSGLTSRSVSPGTKNGDSYYTSNYTLAVDFYPTQGSCTVDVWGGSESYFTNHLNLNGYTAGSDASTVSDEATDPNAIAIGAYVSKNSVTDHNGSSHSLSGSFPNVGDIAYFSSYQESGAGATGEVFPFISAPGATIVSAVNEFDKDGDYSYVNDNAASYGMYRVNGSTTAPYGNMNGTSMATPVAAGIVALWLQASKQEGAAYTDLTVNKVKEIMKATAITDTWTTTGSNYTHFGNGKIDALAGIQMILGSSNGPTLKATPATLAFDSVTVNTDSTATITVVGKKLTAAVSVRSTSSAFTVSPATIALADSTVNQAVTVTFKPTKAAKYDGYIVVTSGALADTVTVSGVGRLLAYTPVMAPADSAYVNLTQFRARWSDATPAENVSSYTLYVNTKPKATWSKLWDENFSGLTSNYNGKSISSLLSSLADVSGWSGSRVYGTSTAGVVRLGSASYSGYIVTPSLDLSKSKGKVTVRFNARCYDSGSSVVVSCGSAKSTVALTSSFADHTVVLDCESATGQTVKFATTGSGRRVEINNVTLYSGDTTATSSASAPRKAIIETGDSTTRVITGITDTTYTVKDLTAGGTFNYYVKAVYTDGTESAASNVETVTLFSQETSKVGDINMDGLVDVADVTTLINYILGNNPSPCNLTYADLTGDGIYDVADVTELINLIASQP